MDQIRRHLLPGLPYLEPCFTHEESKQIVHELGLFCLHIFSYLSYLIVVVKV